MQQQARKWGLVVVVVVMGGWGVRGNQRVAAQHLIKSNPRTSAELRLRLGEGGVVVVEVTSCVASPCGEHLSLVNCSFSFLPLNP